MQRNPLQNYTVINETKGKEKVLRTIRKKRHYLSGSTNGNDSGFLTGNYGAQKEEAKYLSKKEGNVRHKFYVRGDYPSGKKKKK